MQDTAQARRPTDSTGEDSTSDDNWLETPTFDALFETRCKVTGGSRASADVAVRMVNVGGVERPVIEGGLRVPIPEAGSLAADLREGDQFVITAIGPATDPSVLGAVFQVDGFGGKSWATARRLDVVQVGKEEV